MHGIPPDLPLVRFVGHQCSQIALGQFQIQFHFAEIGTISIESCWELRSSEGEIIDAAAEHSSRDCYRIHRIIGIAVAAFTIDSPKAFTLFFESGDALTVFDDSDRYESFSLHLEGEGSICI